MGQGSMAKKKKKDEKLSKRQRQSKQIMREKELQLKRQQFMNRFKIGFAVFISVSLVFIGVWAWKHNSFSKMAQIASDKIYGVTVKAGYAVDNMYIEGRSRTPMDEINKALDIDKGQPIMSLKLDEIRARLEKIESIKYAAIERALPNTLYVRVLEREPVALWQYQGKTALVDDNGVVMNGIDIAPYKSLPLIVGADAPMHVNSLLELLASQPELAKRFSAAVWIGERRWNIKMRPSANLSAVSDQAEDIEVRLPEKDSLAAWKQLAELQKKEQLLDRDIKVIDLRIDGRLFIKLPANDVRTKPINAKET